MKLTNSKKDILRKAIRKAAEEMPAHELSKIVQEEIDMIFKFISECKANIGE